MPKSGHDQTKESTKIRRELNRRQRHATKRVLRKTQDETKIPAFKNTEGWETW